MRHLTLLLGLLASVSLFSQKNKSVSALPDTVRLHWHQQDKAEPTDKEVLLKVVVVDFARAKVPGLEVRAVDAKTGNVWQGFTGKYGEVHFLLPKGRDYRIDVGGEQGLRAVSLPDKRKEQVPCTITYSVTDFREDARGDTLYQRVSPAQMPTHERVLVHLLVLDLDDKPLEDEVLYFAAKKAGKVFVARTNRTGDAWMMLPQGDNFCISARYDANMHCFDIPNTGMAGKLNITCNTIGSKVIEQRKAERARQAAVRDSLFQAKRAQDSIHLVDRAKQMLENGENILLLLRDGMPPAKVQEYIEKHAASERDSIALDSSYFAKKREDVKSVLYRNRLAWSQKTIVTDLTCSMEPYIDQVLLWHALQLVQGEANRYIFFNDGDGKAQEQKIAGQTGGFHYTDQADMKSLMRAMVETIKYGCSGDSPENDLEALLEGVKKRSGMDELVLIADNYSDVRDIELLSELQLPVHIILCGTENGVNEDYLKIAYKTGGSIHTIEQDIDHLTKLADGETITIGAHKYRVCRGEFIKVTRI